MTYNDIINELESNRDPAALPFMAKYGITPERAYGVKIPVLRDIAKRAGRDHALALRLWNTDTRETRILASMIAEPAKSTPELLDAWAEQFTYWEICDACCMNLFEKTPFSYDKAFEWSAREEEGVKRAGFVMMARLAVSDKKAPNKKFEAFLPIIEREAADPRNMVKKGVNWALRQIGKRSHALNKKAVAAAEKLRTSKSPAARWVAADALRELTDSKTIARIKH